MTVPGYITPQRGRQLRVGIVGFGQRAVISRHVEASDTLAHVTAVLDTDTAGLDRAEKFFGSSVSLYSDLSEFIAKSGLDAAIVATPDWTHAPIAIQLLRAGIAVYLEKPMAITLEDADAILLVAAETGTPLYVGHNFRHSAVVKLMREIIERGDIGRVKAVWCRHFVGNGGDYYFRDWHAERVRVNSLLLQKASHDIDVIHLLAGAYTRRVVGMGDLLVYGDVGDRHEHSGQTMPDWFSLDNWPPLELKGLNPIIDVEDVSMMMMTLSNGVLASYEQCHFTPDYWRSYTVIGTEGRLENFGDTAGGVVRVWNQRHGGQHAGDQEYEITGVSTGHDDADLLTVSEFLNHVATQTPTRISPVAAREAVAAGALATQSLRSGSIPLDVPPLAPSVEVFFGLPPATPTG